jgi:hypothetical protein
MNEILEDYILYEPLMYLYGTSGQLHYAYYWGFVIKDNKSGNLSAVDKLGNILDPSGFHRLMKMKAFW